MQLLLGLGNPGPEYAATRHNVGFLFIDYLAVHHGISLKREGKWEAEVGRGVLWGRPVLLAKPLTFMNRSGIAAARLAHFYRLEPADLVVFHDELDLPFNSCRVVKSRGAGGHNGIRSLMEHLGSRDFVRFRIGVGRPPGERPAAGYVLSPFTAAERHLLDRHFSLLEKGLQQLLQHDEKAAMNLVNTSTAEARRMGIEAGSGGSTS